MNLLWVNIFLVKKRLLSFFEIMQEILDFQFEKEGSIITRMAKRVDETSFVIVKESRMIKMWIIQNNKEIEPPQDVGVRFICG